VTKQRWWMIDWQVYSPAGRRILASMHLGYRPAFLASDTGWKLMAVSQIGSLQLWDLKSQQLIADGSLDPLLHGTPPHVTGAPPLPLALYERQHHVFLQCTHARTRGPANDGVVALSAVVAMRLSQSGLPLATLSNNTAYALHLGMKSWMSVADCNFSYTSYASILTSADSSSGVFLCASGVILKCISPYLIPLQSIWRVPEATNRFANRE
jgi:protein HIRA/HIR1